MKNKRALVITLVVSIALNLVAVGIFLGRQAGPRPEMHRVDPVFGMRRLLGDLPEQRARELAPLYREYFAAMRPRFREIRGAQEALRGAMLTDPLDQAELRNALQSFEDQLSSSQQATQDAFVTLAAELTLSERQQLVENMGKRPNGGDRIGEQDPVPMKVRRQGVSGRLITTFHRNHHRSDSHRGAGRIHGPYPEDLPRSSGPL